MAYMSWSMEEIVSAVNGKIVNKSGKYNSFKDIKIDSRNISSGDLFIAINGTNNKGVKFLNEAIKNGARGVLIEKNDEKLIDPYQIKKNHISCVIVKKTTSALANLALFHRKRLNIKVIAITGSVGKTTTRQMVHRISSQKYSTISTTDNMNNHIGLPLSMLNAKKHHRVVVLELGMSNFGEIRELSRICEPDLGIITNVAPTHLENLQNTENIVKAKSEILEHIKSNGSIILNYDDLLVRPIRKLTRLNVIFFGTNKKANIVGKKIIPTDRRINFLLRTSCGEIDICLVSPSKALVSNALAASAAGIWLNCSNNEIKKGIESYRPYHGRMKRIKTKIEGFEIIDDTYNSSPVSVKNAIETLVSIKKHCYTIIVMGDMLELGKSSKIMHQNIGKLIAKSNIDRLYSTGFFAQEVAIGAILAKMPKKKIYTGDKASIIKDLKKYLKKDHIILFKGSRKAKLEKIVFEIVNICNLKKS